MKPINFYVIFGNFSLALFIAVQPSSIRGSYINLLPRVEAFILHLELFQMENKSCSPVCHITASCRFPSQWSLAKTYTDLYKGCLWPKHTISLINTLKGENEEDFISSSTKWAIESLQAKKKKKVNCNFSSAGTKNKDHVTISVAAMTTYSRPECLISYPLPSFSSHVKCCLNQDQVLGLYSKGLEMISRNDNAEQTPRNRYAQMEQYKKIESSLWPFRIWSVIKVFLPSGMDFQTQETPWNTTSHFFIGSITRREGRLKLLTNHKHQSVFK